nr:hypothetical protein [Tanacetum cinerariifolium]
MMPYGDSLIFSSPTTYSVSSISKTGKLEGRLTLIRRNLLGSTSRRSDATSVNKEAILPGKAGQKEEMTSRDTPHSRIRRLEGRKKIQKPWFLFILWLISQTMIVNVMTLLLLKNLEANTPGDAGEFALMGVTSKESKIDDDGVLDVLSLDAS